MEYNYSERKVVQRKSMGAQKGERSKSRGGTLELEVVTGHV
jgi:hypothetical protein